MKLLKLIFNHPGLLLLLSRAVVGYDNGLARTPQMGWNTWNRFGCDIDEKLIVQSAKVVAERLRVYGYECACRRSYISTDLRTSVGTFVDLFIHRHRYG